MKKLLSVIAAAAAAVIMGTTVFADTIVGDGAPTISFDTPASLTYIHKFGNAEEANLKLELTESDALSGKGLKVSEDFKGSLSNRYGGFYLDSADFGLKSFAGYKMTIYINCSSKASKATSHFELFSDGDQWMTQTFLTEAPGNYRMVSITVPADKNNTKIGVTFPITDSFSADLGVFDDITIEDNYGEKIPNIGDIDNSLYKGPSGFISLLTTLLFVVLAGGVIFCVVYFTIKAKRKFR